MFSISAAQLAEGIQCEPKLKPHSHCLSLFFLSPNEYRTKELTPTRQQLLDSPVEAITQALPHAVHGSQLLYEALVGRDARATRPHAPVQPQAHVQPSLRPRVRH